MSKSALDAIRTQVMWNRLIAVVEEQAQSLLRTAFGTTQPVYLSTSSAWGIMEGSVRNLVAKKVLNCCCGAFSDKWYDVSLSCGKQAEALKVLGKCGSRPFVISQLHSSLRR